MSARLASHPPLEFDASGTPRSTLFQDVYRSRAGAWEEARSVFVEGCGLPTRWHDSARFTVLEIGFGLGVNFLATLAAFEQDPQAPRRLNFVSLEAVPVTLEDLQRAHESLGLSGEAVSRLRAQWPLALPGLHRLSFAAGRVVLWLAFGEARALLPRLRLRADAFFLDGFAPSKNPSAWDAALMRQLARLAAPGARLASYTVARPVRDALSHAGFSVSIAPGFGAKRERLEAAYAPRWPTWAPPPPPPKWTRRHAVVIGAGLAGCAVSETLVREGWTVSLIDQRPAPMSEGSKQPLCADHLHVSPDDNLLARLTRAALLLGRSTGAAGEAAALGKLVVAESSESFERQTDLVARLAFPREFAQVLDRSSASDLSGCALPEGGLWLPGCTVHSPRVVADTLLQTAGGALTFKPDTHVTGLDFADGEWHLRGSTGSPVDCAPVVVLCNAGDAARLARMGSLSLRRVRGQSSWVRAERLQRLRVILGGAAYVVPAQGRVLVGSSFDDGDALTFDAEADLSNARRLARMLGQDLDTFASSVSPAAIGHRWAAPDRLPAIGQLPDELRASLDAAQLLRHDKLPLPRVPGLFTATAFGSRGLLWSRLAAELLSAEINGDPMGLESDLLAAIDPARALRRRLRQGWRAS